MNREEREELVRRVLASTGAHGLALDALVNSIVDTWEHDVANKRYEQTALMVTGKWRADNPTGHAFVWRLTLVCGHLKLWGPFADGSHQKYVGDHTVCDICPKVRSFGTKISQQHLIAKVEEVDPRDCALDWLEVGLT